MGEERKTNKKYCYHYSPTQQKCPYKTDFERIAWECEKQVCEAKTSPQDISEFLHFVANTMSNYDKKILARYIAEYACYDSDDSIINAKKFICETHKLQDILFFEKPLGQTIYETIDEGTYVPESEGTLLYDDGRIYTMFGNSDSKKHSYVLEATSRPFADKIKAFIEKNREVIQSFPDETTEAPFCDGSYQYYKFLNKKCHGYMMYCTDDGQKIISFAKKIDARFRKHAFPISNSANFAAVVCF